MKKTVFWLIALIALLALSYYSYYSMISRYESQKAPENDKTEEPIKAPDFTVYDASGSEVLLSDFSGSPIVLNFWASWCPPCKGEMPGFDKAYLEYKDNIVFLMVDVVDGQRETTESGAEYVKNQGYSFPVYFDTDQDAATSYSITGIPMTLFIDEEGFIERGYSGAISEEILYKEIKNLLNAE